MLAENERAALQFSGGKDSLALLHLARPYIDRITVFFGDTGAIYPHVFEFVVETCKELGAKLVIVDPPLNVIDYTNQYGLPSDIVPVNATHDMARWMPVKPKQLIQASLSCCGQMVWRPMMAAIEKAGLNIVLRGSKSTDPHVTVPDGYVENGTEYRSPLWDWTDEDVLSYLKDKKMPKQYPEIVDSMDCWVCTAHMGGKYAGAKLEFAKKNYPELWPEIERRIRAVRETVRTETAVIETALAVAS